MNNWTYSRLENYVDLLTGFPFKSEFFTDKLDDIHLIKGENLHQKYIDWETSKKWSKEEYSTLIKYQLHAGDIVLAMDRPWIEAGLKYAWIKKHDPRCLLVQRVSRLKGKNGLETNYLRYIIGSPEFSGYIKNIVTGVNVPHISPTQILNFKFNLPPLPIQQKIATILSAYDELIENNKQRIKLLEQMVEEIYKEWFVRFRFPGHEGVKMVDGLPEGWENQKMETFVDVTDGTHDSPKSSAIGFPLVTGKNIKDGFIDLCDTYLISNDEHDKIQKRSYLSIGDVIISNIGTIGSTALILEKPQFSVKNVIIIRPQKSIASNYVYTFIKSNNIQMIFQNEMSGASQQFLSLSYMRNFKILVPSNEVLSNFEIIVGEYYKLRNTLYQKNQLLQQTRDLLLPRLISGKLSVEHLVEAEGN